MTKNLLFLIAFLFSMEAMAQNEPFIFFDGTFEQMQLRGKNAAKPYFVYFYANWCMPAKEMNDKTFRNKYLVGFAQKNYLGLAFDGESLITEGKALADRFHILYYPTVIIFSSNGKELKRLYGEQSPAQLLDALRKYQGNNAEAGPNDVYEAPSFTGEDGEFLFKMVVSKQPFEGYGIQVGVFSSYRNAFVRLLELEEDHAQRSVLVHVVEQGDESLFKLILGPFDSEEQARLYLKVLENKQKIKGIVVVLDDLE